MRVRLSHKIVALVLLASIVPLTAVSVLLIGIGRRNVEATVQQLHQFEANAAASRVSVFLQRVKERLVADLEGSIESMSDEDVQLALVWMLGKQDNLLTFRVLRAHDGQGVPIGAEPIVLPASSIPEEQHAHYLVLPEDVATFSRQVPLAACLASGEPELSKVYFNERRGEALLAMAVPIQDRFRQVVGVVTGEVSLRDVQRIVADVTVGTVGYAFLVDADGNPVAHPKHDLVKSRTNLMHSAIVEAALRTERSGAISFDSEEGVPQLGAFAPIFWGGWQLVVQQPATDAYHSVTEMKQRAGFILAVALVASLIAGLGSVRSLTRPLAQVVDGMRHIVNGSFAHRLEVSTRDEVGELAGAFNAMGAMLVKSRAEIETWNAELQHRVDAKTKALESAQAHLVQGAKLASLGQLGAGVAHELNNPLAGVVGHAALLRRRLRKLELPEAERTKLEGYLEHVERESSRCREIIHGLLSFSQAQSTGSDHVDANACVERMLMLTASHAKAEGVTMTTQLGEGLPLVRANEQHVQQALMNILTNARQAVDGQGTITVTTSLADDEVRIAVRDTGRGIASENIDRIFDPFFTTKDVWTSPGLGLSVAWSSVEAHGGRIEVESEHGRGSTFTIVLPTVRRAADATPPPGLNAPLKEHVGLRRGKAALAGSSR